jgi:hypothetical protein
MTPAVTRPTVPTCNLWTPDRAKTPAYLAETSHLLILMGLLIAQGWLHFPEHVAQFLQRFYIGMPANGILGQLNVEWVHVVYNWGLLLLMIPVLVGCGFFARGNAWRRYNAVAWGGIVASFWIQVWHAFEHYGKLAQYYRNVSLTPPVVPPDGPNAAGLLGQWLLNTGGPSAVVLLHFTINLVVLIPIIYAFFAFDIPGALAARLREALQPAPVEATES